MGGTILVASDKPLPTSPLPGLMKLTTAWPVTYRFQKWCLFDLFIVKFCKYVGCYLYLIGYNNRGTKITLSAAQSSYNSRIFGKLYSSFSDKQIRKLHKISSIRFPPFKWWLLLLFKVKFDSSLSFNDGGACWKLLRDTLKGTRILFDGRGSNEFLLLRGTNSKSACHINFV